MDKVGLSLKETVEELDQELRLHDEALDIERCRVLSAHAAQLVKDEASEAFLHVEGNGTPPGTKVSVNGVKVLGVNGVTWELAVGEDTPMPWVRLQARAQVEIKHSPRPHPAFEPAPFANDVQRAGIEFETPGQVESRMEREQS